MAGLSSSDAYRSASVALAVSGLTLFVSVFGFAIHSWLGENAAWLPPWVRVAVPAITPLLLVLVIGLATSLCENRRYGPYARRAGQGLGVLMVFALAMWRLGAF
ncbi:hypothetical protein MalM25_09930 [Planctomycetes bacterium MalM25]|nr:hypothetical protein MalM25_09930 [Planctomycetes bacterium MalM25]